MFGGDEVQEGNTQGEMQEKMLTDEEIKQIKEEVDEEESAELLVSQLKKTIDTILVEEFFETNTKMNEFRKVLARGVMLFAEKHGEDKAKVDRLLDSFRAAWKIYGERGNEKTTMDEFTKEMDNALWITNDSEDTDVFGV